MILNQSKDHAYNISVVGVGYWGKNLVRNYYELGSLHTICDRDTEVLRTFTDRYRGVRTTTDYNNILNNPEIHGVVIPLPAEMHYHFAHEALMANKHVYVEKPLTINIHDAEKLVSLAREKKRILMVGHLLHYHPVFQRLKELVLSNELGEIYYIYSNRLSLGKIRTEENILWSFAPHDISMILSLCGEEPSYVHATGGGFIKKDILDMATINLFFPNGIKSHIFVSWLHPFKEHKLVVVGQKKMAVFSDSEEWDNKLLLFSHSINWDNGVPVPVKTGSERVVVEKSEPLKNECKHFLDCIKNDSVPITDGVEGINVLKVLHKSQKCIDII